MLSLDGLQVFFWCATYILVIIFQIKNHQLGIPPIAMVNNAAWETVALATGVLGEGLGQQTLMRFSWFLLDVGIIVSFFLFCKPVYTTKKSNLILIYILAVMIFSIVFIRNNTGLLVSSFVIDFLMALEWFLYNSTYEKLRITKVVLLFCLTKLIGDLCAYMYYKSFNESIRFLGIIVLFLNLSCLAVSSLRYRREQKSGRRKNDICK